LQGFHRGCSRLELEPFVDKNHILRKLDPLIDDEAVRSLVAKKYHKSGRPSHDPSLLFRALIIEYLFGLKSDRLLCRQINENLAYRWFCRLGFANSVFDHSAVTRFRDRVGLSFFRTAFNDVVKYCRDTGLVSGTSIVTDSTLIKANASLDSLEEISPSKDVTNPKKTYIQQNTSQQN
jgi:transposase